MVLQVRITCPAPKGCGRRFTRPQGSRRKFCEDCSPSRVKPLELQASGPADDSAKPGRIEARLLADLVAVERAGTVDGLVALSVARDLDQGRVTPSQKPAVGQKLAQLRATALEGTAAPTQDRADELLQQRQRRRGIA